MNLLYKPISAIYVFGFLLLLSCNQSIERDAFHGLKLGTSLIQYYKSLNNRAIFKNYEGRGYYQFTINKKKTFFGSFLVTMNDDSLVTQIEIFMCQSNKEITSVGIAEKTNNDMELNLVEVEDSEVANEKEIYTYIKSSLDSSYKLISSDSSHYSVHFGIDECLRIYQGKDMTVTLSRMISTFPVSWAWEPVGRTKVTYKYTDEFREKNNLNKPVQKRKEF